MNKFFISLLLFLLSACDHFGSTKTIVELTPKISVEQSEPIKLLAQSNGIDFKENQKHDSYKINNANFISTPVIAKGVVYTIDQAGTVSAFELESKKILWSTKLLAQKTYFVPNKGEILYSNGRLYVTYGTREMVILDSGKGAEILRKTFPDIITAKPVMLDDKKIVVQTNSNQLLAFDSEKPGFIWQHEGGIDALTSQNQMQPLNVNGNILASYSSGELVYVDGDTGKIKWSKSIGGSHDYLMLDDEMEPSVVVGKPIIYNDVMYLATTRGQLLKMNLSNGKSVWQKQVSDMQSIALSGDNLVVTTNAKQVLAISSKNGVVKWSADLVTPENKRAKATSELYHAPFVVSDMDDVLSVNIVSSGGVLYQFPVSAEGIISTAPKIIAIPKDVRHYWISCCNNKIHYFSGSSVSF